MWNRVRRELREHRGGGRREAERGATLVLVLVVSAAVVLLSATLLFVTDIELRSSVNSSDDQAAFNDADSALAEVLYRLNLEPVPGSPPPDGSRISVNSLVNYDASLYYDPLDQLYNRVDDDGDGTTDEVDELEYNREWEVRILNVTTEPNPGSPYEVADADPATSPWGVKRVEATIQPYASWKDYSVANPADAEALFLRFKTDMDTPLGDIDGDGEPQLVYYDIELTLNGADDPNTITGLGFDGDASNDSPYNVTFTDGGTGIVYQASGSPVVLVSATARSHRGPNVAGEREVLAEVVYPMRKVWGKALCACGDVTAGGTPDTDSYKSSEGPYGGLVYENGDVGANGNLDLDGTIKGDAEAGGYIHDSDGVVHDAIAGDEITGTPGDEASAYYRPRPEPCVCDLPIDDMLAEADLIKDNAAAPAGCQGPDLNLNGTDVCTYDCGTYVFDRINVVGGASIVIGDVSCGPVKFFVTGDISLGGNGLVNANRPEDFAIVATTEPPDLITIAGTNDFTGTIYAPLSDVKINGTTDVYGSVLGKEVTKFNGTPSIHYDEDLNGMVRVPADFKVIAWKEIE